MSHSVLSYLAVVFICITSMLCLHASAESPLVETKPESGIADEYAGKWTIRFYRVDSNPMTRPEDILFGCWKLSFDQIRAEQVRGTMEWDGWPLPFQGTTGGGTDRRITFEASGKIDNDTWSIRCEGARPLEVAPNTQLPSSLMGTALISSQLSGNQGGRSSTIPCHWIAIKQSSGKRDPAEWTLKSVNDRLFDSREIKRTTALVFSKGFSCAHCNEQMRLLNKHSEDFVSRNTDVVFVVSDTVINLKSAMADTKVQYQILSDPSLDVFRQYGLDENHRSHGVVLIDNNRDVKWSVHGSTPFMDIDEFLKRVEEVRVKE